MPPCRLLSPVLGVFLLAGCASVGTATQADAGREAFERAAQQDSMRSECDWNVRYAPVAPPDASVAQLRAIATARLAALQLAPAWTLAMPGGDHRLAHREAETAKAHRG